jgi:hypothetical protein
MHENKNGALTKCFHSYKKHFADGGVIAFMLNAKQTENYYYYYYQRNSSRLFDA